MNRRNESPSLRLTLGLIFALATGFLPLRAGPEQAQGSSASKQQESAPAAAQSPSYTGAEACKTCHADIYADFEKTPHWKTMLDTRGGPEKQGCEACHGPGADHASDPADKTKIFDFKKASAAKVNERCLSCHESGKEQINYARSVHEKNNVSCIDCHSPHHAKEPEFLLAKEQPQLCYGCHLQVKPQFNMPFHHRVNEGLVRCSDCHNPHGGFLAKQLRTSTAQQNAACFNCHADKAGPFVFEHQPVKTEGCTSCHVPHGSPNPHLLKLSQMNLLCLQCHTPSSFSGAPGTPSFHNQAAQFQACTLCHTQIHGSNFNSFFLK